MTDFDTIVLGCGGAGSAALYHLAKRGARALGIEQFIPGHNRGSSHGQSRLIRLAYLEHPNYVPLVQRAMTLWRELEEASETSLLEQTGLVQVGPAEGAVVGGVLASAKAYGIEVELLDGADAQGRFGPLRIPEESTAVYEPTAGVLAVEKCVKAHAQRAVDAGATLRFNERVTGWEVDGDGVAVTTHQGTYRADSLVIAAGAWAPEFLADLGVPMEVRRKSMFWFDAPESFDNASGFPTFLVDTGDGQFYGMPRREGRIKVAEHTGGVAMSDPAALAHNVAPLEEQRVRAMLKGYLPEALGEVKDHVACMYTVSPDEHFIVDIHPEHPQVCFAAGLSGHGFKFAPILGEILADLATARRTDHGIGFLGVGRFS